MKHETHRITLAAGLLLALLGAAGPAPAVNCPGPDVFGHQCVDNPTLCVLEAPAASVGITLDEECIVRSIGFSFDFYGITYTDVGVHSNGFVELGGCFTLPSAYQNACPQPDAKAPNAAIYGVWDDLDPNSGGTIEDGLSGAAPDQVYTVEWSGVPEFGQPTSVTVQIQLHENGGPPNEGVVRVYIQNADSGDYTSGIENATGTDALTRYCDNGVTGVGICTEYFFPAGPPDPAIQALEAKADLAEGKLDSLEAKVDLMDPAAIAAIEGKLDVNLDDAVTSRASQASVDALEAKADALEAKVDLLDTAGLAAIEGKLDTGLDATITSRATQASVDALETKADALEAKVDLLDTSGIAAIEGKLDASLDATITSRATQASVDALEVKADALEVKADALETKVDALDLTAIAAIEGKLDANLDDTITSRASQASVDALETKVDALDLTAIAVIEGKLDANLDDTITSRASQASVDALETKADALEAKMDNGAQAIAAIEGKLDSGAQAIGAIEGKLDTNLDATVSSRATQASVDAIEVKLDANSQDVAAIEAKMDASGQAVAAVEGKLDAALDDTVTSRASQASMDAVEIKADAMEVKLDAIQAAVGGGGTGPVSIADQLQLEQLLCNAFCTPDMMLPNANGGVLEDVRDWVIQQLNETEAAGDPLLIAVIPLARNHWNQGNTYMTMGRYSQACTAYATALKYICKRT